MRRTAAALVTLFALVMPLGCVMHKTSTATFCKELRRTPNLTEVFGALTTANPAALREQARQTSQQFTRLQRSAPRDIRSDVSEVANLASKVAQAVENSPNDPAAIAAALRRQASDMLGPTRAALKLALYSKDKCNYDLNNPGGTSLPSVVPSTFPLPPTTR